MKTEVSFNFNKKGTRQKYISCLPLLPMATEDLSRTDNACHNESSVINT